VVTRPNAELVRAGPPALLSAANKAGTFVLPFGGSWRYDGFAAALVLVAPVIPLTEHAAPGGGLVAIERLTHTPGGYLVATALAIRDSQGIEHVVYRAPQSFYWASWSPDGRYVLVWEVDFFSGSIDLDGRPLLVLDASTGERVDLGRTLLNGTTAWTAPHTLAFVVGRGRMVWDTKTLRLWAPETGIRDVTTADSAALAPAWSADGRSLFFTSGPAGAYEPLEFFAGRGIGDRRISVYDTATGAIRVLPHEPGYVEEAARPSRDGQKLLVLRRKTVATSDLRSIPDAPLEGWLTDAGGQHGSALVRVAHAGFGYYGWYPGPADWEWSE